MSEKCKNYCVESLTFPKIIENRPGLTRIDYRIGAYADIRGEIIRRLNNVPVLGNWTYRGSDDPGIALIEAISLVGDILTFYQEVYANEAYLRTAAWRESVADLVRLLGYRLSPGLGGKGKFAFVIKGDKPVLVPSGFPVKAQIEGSEQPVDFETMKETLAIPQISKFSLYHPWYVPNFPAEVTTFSVKTAQLKEAGLEVKEKDRFMLLDTSSAPTVNTQIVIVKEVEEILDRTMVTIEGSWKKWGGTGNTVLAFKLGRSFRHFGHNAPSEVVASVSGSLQPVRIGYLRNLHASTTQDNLWKIDPAIKARNLPLDSDVGDIIVGSHLIIQGIDSFDRSRLLMEIVERGPAIESPGGKVVRKKYSPNPGFGEDVSPPFEYEELLRDVTRENIWSEVKAQIASEVAFETGKTTTIVKKIEDFRSASMTWGALTGAATIVTIDAEMDDRSGTKSVSAGTNQFQVTDIRNLVFHETTGKGPVTFRNVPQVDSSAKGTCLYFYGDATSYSQLNNRSIALLKEDGFSMKTVVETADSESTESDQKKLRKLVLKTPLENGFSESDFPFDEPKVTVFGNLVEANQGKTQKEAVLGNGDSREKFQTFKIPKAPLTYLNSSGETPPEIPELQIYVNDHLWKRVASFFGYRPADEIYIVREDAKGDSWVQFGDGKTGSKLPSGTKNIIARYRTGTGAYGALKDETTVQAGGKLDRLAKVHLPGVISGGSQAESAENARKAAPGKIQSLGRLVGLSDFEFEALAISGVSKAKVRWERVENVPSVVVTVLMEAGRNEEFSEVKKILTSYNRCRGMDRFPISVAEGTRRYVCLDATFRIHSAFLEEKVKDEIKATLGVVFEGNNVNNAEGLFGLEKREFGQNEYATRVEGIIQNVEGVTWAKVKAFGVTSGSSDKPSELSLPTEPKPLHAIIACDGFHVLALYEDHLSLTCSRTQTSEEC